MLNRAYYTAHTSLLCTQLKILTPYRVTTIHIHWLFESLLMILPFQNPILKVNMISGSRRFQQVLGQVRTPFDGSRIFFGSKLFTINQFGKFS